jgi:hypothetical protein
LVTTTGNTRGKNRDAHEHRQRNFDALHLNYTCEKVCSGHGRSSKNLDV